MTTASSSIRLNDRLRNSPLRHVPRVFFALFALVVFLGIVSPLSVAPENLVNLIRQGAALGTVAIGQTVVLINGGLDLSVGSTVILSDVLAAMLISGREALVVPVVALVLFIGALIGFVNGLLITRFNVTPFIATLGMNFIVYGAALVFSGGAPRGDIPDSMRFWGNGFIGGVFPSAALIWIVITLLAALMLRRTTFGRRLVAVGANRLAARLSGVRERTVTLLAYTFSSLMASAGGLLLVAYVGTGTLEVGTDFLLGSIAASVIGGTPFEGGRGTIWGTFGGILFLMVLYSILTVLALPTSGRRMVEGIIILIAVALYARSRD
jgi:ribose transport system permease protein